MSALRPVWIVRWWPVASSNRQKVQSHLQETWVRSDLHRTEAEARSVVESYFGHRILSIEEVVRSER